MLRAQLLRLASMCLLALAASACSSSSGGDPAADSGPLDSASLDAGLDQVPSGDTSGAPDQGATPKVVEALASRTRGVAPLAVFFDAVGTAGVVQPPEVDGRREYADLRYVWNFGDSAAGTWAISGRPKNRATGFVAAHVFEEPGSYTVGLEVSDATGSLGRYRVTIIVDDPAVVYAGAKTTCVSTGSSFDGCPAGAKQLSGLTDFAALASSLVAGQRVLLRRGDQWTTSASLEPASGGPMTIGAFGSCQSPDARGICANAPLITATGGVGPAIFETAHRGFSDVRFMDLELRSATRHGAIGGVYKMRDVLLLRIKTRGWDTPLGNSHWEHRGHDQISIVECDAAESKSNIVYVGAGRLAVLGNRLRDPSDSHVLRVWHAPKGVIAHNELSGSSVDSNSGRHALKMHGPSETELADTGASGLDGRTRYVIVAQNLIGGSGPWPMAIGPQDGGQDERLEDIVIEQNRFFSGFGTQSCCSSPVQVALQLWARHVTVRNNIFSGEGASNYFTGIAVGQRGVEPPPLGVRIFNNTFYRVTTAGQEPPLAVQIGAKADKTQVRNNLAHFAPAGTLLGGAGSGLVEDHNLVTQDAALADPGAAGFLNKDFRPKATSAAVGAGVAGLVFDDLEGALRAASVDLGALIAAP